MTNQEDTKYNVVKDYKSHTFLIEALSQSSTKSKFETLALTLLDQLEGVFTGITKDKFVNEYKELLDYMRGKINV